MPVDYFRDTWIRYLGYANEVGEAFRGVVPRSVVMLSYKVAFGYVAADTLSKSISEMRKDPNPVKVALAAGDALIWQTLASVVIPGFTIDNMCIFQPNALPLRERRLPSSSLGHGGGHRAGLYPHHNTPHRRRCNCLHGPHV